MILCFLRFYCRIDLIGWFQYSITNSDDGCTCILHTRCYLSCWHPSVGERPRRHSKYCSLPVSCRRKYPSEVVEVSLRKQSLIFIFQTPSKYKLQDLHGCLRRESARARTTAAHDSPVYSLRTTARHLTTSLLTPSPLPSPKSRIGKSILKQVDAPRPADCFKLCESHEGCKAWTWSNCSIPDYASTQR